MPNPLTGYNSDLWAAYNSLSASMNSWRNEFYNLGTQIAAENWSAAQTSCIVLGDNFSSLVRADLCDSGGVKGKTYQSLDWIDDNWPTDGDEYVLTMAAILDAMWDAKGGQPLTFINYVDAMRGSVSEKTVYAPYLRSYMKHFM